MFYFVFRCRPLVLARKQVDRLQGSLQDTLSKLADVQSVAASAKLSSDHALSNLASAKVSARVALISSWCVLVCSYSLLIDS